MTRNSKNSKNTLNTLIKHRQTSSKHTNKKTHKLLGRKEPAKTQRGKKAPAKTHRGKKANTVGIRRNVKTTKNIFNSKIFQDIDLDSEDLLTIDRKEAEKYFKTFEFTVKNDKHYDRYRHKDEYIALKESNPSIFVVNYIFLNILNTSFIDLLLKENNEDFVSCLTFYLHFRKLVKGEEGKYPIIELLIKHGFETIYDVLLENRESFYLLAFLAHLSSFEVIENPNDFILSLHKNDLHTKLRDKKVIELLQKTKLYTRIKKYQL